MLAAPSSQSVAQTQPVPLYVENSPQFTTYQQTDSPADTKEWKRIKTISSGFLLLAFFSFVQALTLIVIFLILNRAVTTGGGIQFEVLRESPEVALGPFSALGASAVYAFLSALVRDGSRRSWWSALGTLILLPAISSLSLSFSFREIFANIEEVESGIPMSINFAVNSYTSIPFILLFLLLTVSYSHFHFSSSRISKRALSLLLGIYSVTSLLLFSLYGYAFWVASQPYPGYKQAQSQVSFHIHKPATIPKPYKQSTAFTVNTNSETLMVGKTNFVKVVYGTPIFEFDMKYPIIIITQLGVDSDFNLKNTIETSSTPDSEIRSVVISSAVDQEAYYVTRPLASKELRTVSFVRNNVFIQIATLNGAYSDITTLANSLE